MSNSVRPHRRQPTRLPRPWDSPGKNTGVGCHFLLQCMKVKSESEVVQSCPTLSDPMDCSLTGSSIHGIFQARVLEWGAIAFSVYKGCRTIFLLLCLTSLSMTISRSICVAANEWHYFILFNGWIIFHCICVPHLLYPFPCQWIFRLLPCLGCCKKCCNKYWGVCIFLNHSFLQIHAQDCRETPKC